MPQVHHDTGLHQKVNRSVVPKLQPLRPFQVLPVTLAPSLGRGGGQVVGDRSCESPRLDRRGTSGYRRLLKVVQRRQPGARFASALRLGPRSVVRKILGNGRCR